MHPSFAAKLTSLGSRFGIFLTLGILHTITAGLTGSIALAEPLRVSDASIFFPLKRNSAMDDIFKTMGDGFAQAPSLHEGNVLSKATFQKFTDLIMGAQGQETCQPTPDSILDKHFFSPITDQLNPENNVSFINGITEEACRYSNWKVVGFRLDPCLGRAGRNFATKADLQGCTAEARLVAQPFVRQQDGSARVLDLTMHLVYKIPAMDRLVADLKHVMAITKESEKAIPWDSGDGKAQLLRPHHGLRNEMATKGGKVTTAIKNLIATHTNESNMTQIAFMTSSIAVTEWTFGFVNVNGGNISMGANIARAKFDNFSDTAFSANSAFSLNQDLRNLTLSTKAPHLGSYIGLIAKRDFTPADVANNTANIDAMNDILNPLKLNQTSTTCMSCHMAQQAIIRLREAANTPNAVGTRPYKADFTWEHFSFKSRSFLNFRNFGYGPGFEFGVSRRTIHEADSVWKILSMTHP